MDYAVLEDETCRRQTIPERVNAYFTQLDDEDHAKLAQLKEYPQRLHTINTPSNDKNCTVNVDSDDKIHVQTQNGMESTAHHAIAYWISISFLFGAILFFSGSIFWVYQPSMKDQEDPYVLVTVGFFTGTIAFVIGSYLGLYEVINTQDDDTNPKRHKYCFPSKGKKTVSYWTAVSYLYGCLLYQISVTNDMFKIEYPEKSAGEWLIVKLPLFFGGLLFGIGGIGEIIVNEGWKFRPSKLPFWICWLNGIGGILFAAAGGFNMTPDNLLAVQLLWVIGSLFYMVGAVLSLMMWKLHQFGLVYLPDLNRRYTMLYSKKKKRREIVLYTDIFFLCLLTLYAAIGVYAVTFAMLCEHYKDWAKNFALSTVGAVGTVYLGSVLHRVPTVSPYSWLLWFLRVYMLWDMINICIDTWNISGKQCHQYGN